MIGHDRSSSETKNWSEVLELHAMPYYLATLVSLGIKPEFGIAQNGVIR
jgi:hypothetical protein